MSNVMLAADATARRSRLMVTVPFAYRPHRLGYLFDVLRLFAEMPVEHVEMLIYTNTADPAQLDDIAALTEIVRTDNKLFEIISLPGLEHPFDLTWANKASIPDRFLGSTLTHWLHLEDDCRFSYLNLCYFIHYRQKLRPHGLIPSFARFEHNLLQKGFYATDQAHQADIDGHPHIDAGDVFFMILDNVYNATTVLDQELAAEYVQTRSFDRVRSEEVWGWWIAERAAMGLTFENPPPGHFTRMVIPIRKDIAAPATPCLLHHMPNNYTDGWFAGTNVPGVPFGRLRLDKIYTVNGDPGFDPASGHIGETTG